MNELLCALGRVDLDMPSTARVVAKFGLGTYAYFAHISDDGGFGEVLIMIAVMVAFQAELIWRRARALGARTASRPAALARQ